MEIYNTAGTCSRQIIFRVDGENRVSDGKFIGGCSGNLQGIARLVDGQDIDYVISKLKGIICRSGTSCPDQLATALIRYKEKKANKDAEESESK